MWDILAHQYFGLVLVSCFFCVFWGFVGFVCMCGLFGGVFFNLFFYLNA